MKKLHKYSASLRGAFFATRQSSPSLTTESYYRLDCRVAKNAPRNDSRLLTKFLFLFLIIYSFMDMAYASNAITNRYEFKSVADAERFTTLTNETRCIVCQFQNIADSNAPLADSIRGKIYELINSQKSDDEIKAYLVKRYGEVILLKPRFNWATALLWLFPVLALAVFALLFRSFYKPAAYKL